MLYLSELNSVNKIIKLVFTHGQNLHINWTVQETYRVGN